MIRTIMRDLEHLNKKLGFTIKLLYVVVCLVVVWIAFSVINMAHYKSNMRLLVIDVLQSLPTVYDTAEITNI